MTQQNSPWLHFADEVQQFIPIRVGGEIEILHLATPGHFSNSRAEKECFSGFGRFQPATGCIRIGIADEENGLPFIPDHANGQIVRGGVFVHHLQVEGASERGE